MNNLIGYIEKIMSKGNLSLVETNVRGNIFKAIIIGNTTDTVYLKKGAKVEILFNESEVIVGLGFTGKLSIENAFTCQITSVTRGEIFTNLSLSLDGIVITSLLTSNSYDLLNIKEGDNVEVFIKINEVFLKQIDNQVVKDGEN